MAFSAFCEERLFHRPSFSDLTMFLALFYHNFAPLLHFDCRFCHEETEVKYNIMTVNSAEGGK